MLDKLMKMKKEGKMPSHEQKAKMSVLEDLKKQAGEAMGSKLDGVKKVSVMAPNEKGMVEGLDKAKELVSQLHGEGSSEEEASETPEEEISEPMEHEMSEGEDMSMHCSSPEEVDQKIMKLLEMKKAMLGKE